MGKEKQREMAWSSLICIVSVLSCLGSLELKLLEISEENERVYGKLPEAIMDIDMKQYGLMEKLDEIHSKVKKLKMDWKLLQTLILFLCARKWYNDDVSSEPGQKNHQASHKYFLFHLHNSVKRYALDLQTVSRRLEKYGFSYTEQKAFRFEFSFQEEISLSYILCQIVYCYIVRQLGEMNLWLSSTPC
ncbi:hypothetical protein ACH5RR_021289 [Cinchona calisaya]|uniref:Uncharacterized protein n=1 Tax=Cinchona calisaya TaxID=153742 RepID=A0ABD2ZKD0_9GENT